MNKIAKKLLLVALSTVLVGAGTTAVYNVYNEQPAVTASAEAELLAVATFDFGANADATHVEGSNLGETKTYTEGAYTLSLTGMSKVFGGAYDAKGNSCIKLGTSSVVGTFTFTVPDDVEQVVINVAKYKAKESKISVNGTQYTLTKSSDNGEYDVITVDTSSNKTIAFTTVSGGVRCMINSIVYYAAEAAPEAPLPENGATLTIPEALALNTEAAAGNKYYVEGTVSEYTDPYKGALTIKDDAGNEFTIYGMQIVYPPYDEGDEPYVMDYTLMDYTSKPQVGAKVKFYGEITEYSGSNQIANAEFEIISQPEVDPDADLPDDCELLEISDILELNVTKDTLKQYFVTGTVKEIKNSTYGNIYIEDNAGNTLYIYGLYDMWTGDRFDAMETKPAVGDQITVKSILSVYNGTIQLKSAQLSEITVPPVALNLNGETVIEIAAGNADEWEYSFVTAVGYADTAEAYYLVSWDANYTAFVVNYGLENGGMVSAYDGKVELNFYADDFSAMTVTVTLTPYTPTVPTLPELEAGSNEVTIENTWSPAFVQFTATEAGTYTLKAADGETNAQLDLAYYNFNWSDWAQKYDAIYDEVFTSYTFEAEAGDVFYFYVMSYNFEADTINLELVVPGSDVTEPVALNLNGNTTFTIPAGGEQVVVEGYFQGDFNQFTGKFIITWDESVTDLVVNYGRVQNGGIIEHASPMLPVSIPFGSASGEELTVTVNIVPYTEPLQEVVVGNNSVDVMGDGTQVEFKTPGTYVISWAEGETNGTIIVEGNYGSEMIDLPYTFTVAEGESFVFIVVTNDWSMDTIDFVIAVPADGSTLTIEEALALDIEAAAGNKYYVEGTVVRYSDPYKGGLYIADAAGNEICIYGLKKVYNEDYTETFKDLWYMDKPLVGATVKFYGEISSYNNANQFANAEFEIIAQPEVDPDEELPWDLESLTIAEVNALSIEKDTLRQYFVTGIIKEITDTKWGNMYIEDSAGNTLLIYGLYDFYTDARFDKMEVKPAVGDQITVKSIISVYNDQIQLKNARVTDFGPAPIALNLNGTTTIEIPAGGEVMAIGTPDADNFTGYYIVTWDDTTVTNLQVGLSWVCASGMIFDLQSPNVPFEIRFATMDGAALTVDVTIVPYVEVIPEMAVGANAINVADARTGSKVQVSVAGTYTLSVAEGEANAFVMIQTAYGSDMVTLPYAFTVADGDTCVFIVSTANYSADEVNLVLTHACEEYTAATCKAPATCVVCGVAKDDVLADHTYVDGACSVCGVAEPKDEPTDTPTEEPKDEPTDTPTEEPVEDPSILDKVKDKVTGVVPDAVQNMIPGCSGVVGGIAGGLTALGIAAVALLKKKEDNE